MSADDAWNFARLDEQMLVFQADELVTTHSRFSGAPAMSGRLGRKRMYEVKITACLPNEMYEVQFGNGAKTVLPKAELQKMGPEVSVWPSASAQAHKRALKRAIERKLAREGDYGDQEPICDTFDPNEASSSSEAEEGSVSEDSGGSADHDHDAEDGVAADQANGSGDGAAAGGEAV